MYQIKHIGIVGEGKMGSSIFLYLFGHGFRLSWLCSSKEGEDQAMKLFGKKIKILLKSGVITEEEYVKKVESTEFSFHPGILADCDLVIEAIPEDLQMKRQLFNSLDSIINSSCLFTSNSSSILPSQLSPSDKRRDKMAGMHFFFPVNLKKTVEVIRAPGTSQETMDILYRFLISINKSPFPQDENNAFILNRLILDFQACAHQILLEGKLTMKEIDDLVKRRFFSFGIYDFFDHVGIDVMLSSIKAYTKDAANPGFYAPLIRKMEELVSQNRLGLKTKQGFYTYCKTLGSIEKEVSEQMPSKTYLDEVESRLMTAYMDSVNGFLASGVDPDVFAAALKDYLAIERDPLRLMISDC